MIEMAQTEHQGLYQRSFAGDSYNTAVYLARAGYRVSYMTRLGADDFSDQIVQELLAEGIGTQWVERSEQAGPGLYTIRNDDNGERAFHYWRANSAATDLFKHPQTGFDCDVFYFTGITLAVTRQYRDNLLNLLARLRASDCKIVCDPNFRPELWSSVTQAKEYLQAVLPYCDLLLPTMDDERALYGVDTETACCERYSAHNIAELVIKGGNGIAHAFVDGETIVQPATMVEALDTTGAGDSFNAGYLSARLAGQSVAAALTAAQELAATVVQHRGAVLPRQQGVT